MVKIQQCRNQCGQQITVQLDTESGKYKPYDVDPTGSVIGLHNCPNSDYNKQKQWSSSNKQGQLTQYKVNEQLGHIPEQTNAAILNKLEMIYQEVKAIDNNLIAFLTQLADQRKEPIKGKQTEEFGEQGENAASNLEEYDY